jgi:protein MpaA
MNHYKKRLESLVALKNSVNLNYQEKRQTQTKIPLGHAKFALVALLFVLAPGYNQQTAEDLNSEQMTAPPSNAQEQADDLVDTLINHSFYDDTQTLDQETLSSEPASLDPQDRQLSVRSESTKLIEDLGFSGTQDSPGEVIQKKAYCLTHASLEQTVDIAQSCESIANRLASVSSKACNAAKLESSGCQSVGGFPILTSKFPPLEGRQAQGRILVLGGTHGDELTSVSVVFRWIAKLNKFHSGLFHWHITPMMNPDGVLNRAASRTNKNGVDLNRNMPSDDWQTKALSYWQNRGGKDPRKYPGESAASEPETQWLIDEINAFQPDAIISVHAPYGVVDFDSLLLNTAPKSLGKLHLNLLGTYPGSLGNYAGINRNIPVITLELPHAWEMPSEIESTRIWEDIVSWLRDNIDNRPTNNSNAAP